MLHAYMHVSGSGSVSWICFSYMFVSCMHPSGQKIYASYVHSASELGDTSIRTWVKDRDHRYMCIINVCIQVVRRYMHDMYIYHAMAHGYKDHGNMNHTHVHHISTGTRIKAKNQEQ